MWGNVVQDFVYVENLLEARMFKKKRMVELVLPFNGMRISHQKYHL